MLSVVGKIYVWILVDRVCRVTGGLIDARGFRMESGCVDQIFKLKQISERAQEQMQSVCGFYRFGKAVR